MTKISNLGTLLHGFYEKTLLVSQQILCNTIIPLRGMTAKQHEEWGAANTKTRENLGSNGPLKFLTARKILPLLDLLAKFKQVLACSCSPNFCSCSQARKANFLFLLVLAKKSQCSACSRMLAKTIRHPNM